MVGVLQDGVSALMVAAKHDKSGEVTKALLEHSNIDANATDKVGVLGWHCSGGMGVLRGHCMHGMSVVQGRDQGLQAHRAAAGPQRGMGAWWVSTGLAGETVGRQECDDDNMLHAGVQGDVYGRRVCAIFLSPDEL